MLISNLHFKITDNKIKIRKLDKNNGFKFKHHNLTGSHINIKIWWNNIIIKLKNDEQNPSV